MTLDQIKDRLFKIKRDIRQYEYQEFVKELDKIICKVAIPNIITKELHRIDKPFYQDPSIIFRARPNTKTSIKTTMKVPWSNVKEISIISEDEKENVEFGRANKKFEPRFYACNSWDTACYETIWHEFPLNSKSTSAYLTVGVWRILEPLNLVRMPYSPNYINNLKNTESKVNQTIKAIIEEDRKNILAQISGTNTNKELDIFLLDFFTDEFAKQNITDEFDYFFSNYYCDQVFERCWNEHGILDIDGIIYPSISFSYQNDNIVLHPRSIKKIKFIEAFYVWVVYHKNTGKKEYIPIHNAVKADSDGNLSWELFK